MQSERQTTEHLKLLHAGLGVLHGSRLLLAAGSWTRCTIFGAAFWSSAVLGETQIEAEAALRAAAPGANSQQVAMQPAGAQAIGVKGPEPQQPTSNNADTNPEVPSSRPELAGPSLRWDWKASFIQALEFTMFSHLWRVASDPSMRDLLLHKPLYHDWAVSYGGYDLKRWGDGDDFVVNYVGHPLQGAVFSRIFLQNNPRSFVPVSKDRDYWVPLGQSIVWSALWEVQWKVGLLSETSIGNAGGWLYVPDCGTHLSCVQNPHYPKPPTNNTGLTDWIATPLLGATWVLAEDTLDRYVVARVARNHRILGGRVLRAALEPSRDFAALFAGRLVWQLPQFENNYVVTSSPRVIHAKPEQIPYKHWELGMQYTNLSLPALTDQCSQRACRLNLSGTGVNFGYSFFRNFGLDGTANYIPGQKGTNPMMEGLFGLRFGTRSRHVGVFGKVRPGFVYYDKALPGGGVMKPESLTRFATDCGGIVEFYPSQNSSLRLDIGTTLVRYLADRSDPPISQIGSLLSNQHIVTQGNFQISAGYTFHF